MEEEARKLACNMANYHPKHPFCLEQTNKKKWKDQNVIRGTLKIIIANALSVTNRPVSLSVQTKDCPSNLSVSVRLDGQRQCKDKASIPHGLQNGRWVIKVNAIQIFYPDFYETTEEYLICARRWCNSLITGSFLKSSRKLRISWIVMIRMTQWINGTWLWKWNNSIVDLLTINSYPLIHWPCQLCAIVPETLA